MENNEQIEVVRNIVDDIRVLTTILNADDISENEANKIKKLKLSLAKNIDKAAEHVEPNSYEELIVGHAKSLFEFLNQHGFTNDAFYQFQLENGVALGG